MIYTITESSIEEFQKFQTAVNSLPAGEKLTVFIHSGGGSVNVSEMMTNVINSLSNVEIVGSNLSSSAYDLFANCNCKKRLIKSVFGMVHQASWKIEIGQTEPIGDFARFQVEYQKNQRGYDWLTKKERKIYDRGGEVWLDYNRLAQIFPEATS